MFNGLGEKLQNTFKNLTGKGRLGEKDIDDALREIRLTFLEADVNYKVVKSFLADVRQKAIGNDILKSLTPGQQVIKIINDELTNLLGTTAKDIVYSSAFPTVIMMCGVQGSGKTTTASKLANYLKKKNKNVLLAACDTYRAAAVSQLKILGEKIGVKVFYEENKNPVDIAKDAYSYAKKEGYEILIVDTAGRQHINSELMDEIAAIKKVVNPHEILYVLDCMMGQQSVDSACAFNDTVAVTGIVLSKTDSDAKGGAALSVTYSVNKPIKFIGTGEKIEDFELFHPDRIASRILGMGDILSLIEKAQNMTNEEEQKALVKKMAKNAFTLEDYLSQIEQMNNMGGIEEILKQIPGGSKMGNISVNEKQISQTKAIIQSMTIKERVNPQILNASRRKRIAMGSGTTVADVNRLLKGFEQSKKLLKQFSGKKGKLPKFPF